MRGGAAGSAQTGRDVHAAGNERDPAALSARATDTAAAVETEIGTETERRIKLPETKVRSKRGRMFPILKVSKAVVVYLVESGILWSMSTGGSNTSDSVSH